jgi:hypothetical protein
MNKKIQNNFIYSAAVIFFVTAGAKIFSVTGTAQALNYPDQLIPFTNRQMFYAAGGVELIISAFLLMKNEGQKIKLCLVAWFATNLLVYRAGLWWEGAPNLCDCLGSLNEKLPISPRTVNYVMLSALVWLLLGSFLLLIFGRFGSQIISNAKPVSSVKDEIKKT